MKSILRKYFRNSGTIFYAWLQGLAGVVVTGFGLANFSPIEQYLGMTIGGFTKEQILAIGGGLILNGLITYVIRRSAR